MWLIWLLMKIKAEWFSLLYVGRGQLCVCVCMCMHYQKEGVTSPVTLLCWLSSLQPVKQELMQNQFSVLFIFIFFFIFCFYLGVPIPAVCFIFSWRFLNSRCLTELQEVSHSAFWWFPHVLFFIFRNYHKNSLNQFDLFVHLIAQRGSNWGVSHYWADAIII